MLTQGAAWMDPEDTMLSETRQSPKDRHCRFHSQAPSRGVRLTESGSAGARKRGGGGGLVFNGTALQLRKTTSPGDRWWRLHDTRMYLVPLSCVYNGKC